VGPQGGLDLPRLDPQAAELDLPVAAAHELQVAPGRPADQVAGPVQPGAGGGRERVGDERGRGPAAGPVVAVGEQGAADVELPDAAGRDRPHGRVEDGEVAAGDRPAERGPGQPRAAGGELAVGRRHQRLGRAVGVDQADVPGGVPPPALERVRRERLPAGDDHPQGTEVVALPGRGRQHGDLVPVGGRERGHRDAGLGQPPGQLGRRPGGVAPQHQGGPVEGGGQQVLDGHVEAVAVELQHPVAGADAERGGDPAHVGHGAGVPDDHALGAAGGPRGVDAVGGRSGPRPGRGRRPGRRAQRLDPEGAAGLGDGRHRAAVVAQEPPPPDGRVRRDGHVDAAGLEDAKERDQGRRGAVGGDGDEVAGAGPGRPQPPGELGGGGGQLGVAQAALLAGHREGRGGGGGRLGERLRDGPRRAADGRGRGRVAGRGRQGRLVEPLAHAADDGAELLGHGPDRLGLEQGRPVDEVDVEGRAPLHRPDAELVLAGRRHVVLGDAGGEPEGVEVHRRLGLGLRPLAAQGPQDVLDGGLLAGQGVEDGLADAVEPGPERRPRLGPQPQQQGVGEQPHEVGQLAPDAPVHRGGEDQVALPRPGGQDLGERGQEEHVLADPGGVGGRPHGRGRGRVQAQRLGPAGHRHAGPPGPVAGQRQRRRGPGQPLPPGLDLAREPGLALLAP
jgi:hypothetical protein